MPGKKSAGGITSPLREEHALPTSVYADPIVPLAFSFAHQGPGGGGGKGAGSKKDVGGAKGRATGGGGST